MAFTSTATVKAHLGITGTSYDTALAQMILGVDAAITNKTGIATGDDETDLDQGPEIGDSEGDLELRTKYHPINEITAIERRDANRDWEDYTDEVIGDIEFEGYKIFTKYVVAPCGRREVRLTYNAGYVTEAVPDDLRLAATLIVIGMFNTRQIVGFKNQSVLGLTVEMAPEDLEIVKATLTKYSKVYAL